MGSNPLYRIFRGAATFSVSWNLNLDKTAWLCFGHGGSDFRKSMPDKFPPGLVENDDGALTAGQILLVTDVPVGRDKDIESGCFGSVEKFPVPESVSATQTGLFDNVVRQSAGYASWLPVIEQNSHQRWRMGVSRFRAANSSTVLTCSRVIGNCSTTSSMVIPPSKFSKTMATAVRVPVNTHAPLTLPGMRSTPGH